MPPVQYPVAGVQPAAEDSGAVARRQSFNSGDDAAYHTNPQGRTSSALEDDELFLTSPGSSGARQGGFSPASNVLSGYQHQYQDTAPPTTTQHSAYNPQNFVRQASTSFARSQSNALPYRQPSSPQYPPHRVSITSPSSYTPAAYNPAAYAGATSPQRQPTFHGYGASDSAYGAPPVGAQASPTYGTSPATSYSPAIPQQARGIPQSATSPAVSSYSSRTPTSTYDPSQFSRDQYLSRSPNGNSPGQTSHAQAPYPTASYIPVGPNYTSDDHNPVATRDSRSNSQTSPLATSPRQSHSPQGQSQGLRRHPTNAPLPRRPVDDVLEEPAWDGAGEQEHGSYDDDQERLMRDIEAELGGYGPRERQPGGPDNGQHSASYADTQGNPPRRYNSASTAATTSATTSLSTRTPTSSFNGVDDDDDDPEGTAGLLAMRQAELEDRRFSASTFAHTEPPARSNTLPPPPEEQDPASSDSDLGDMVDLGVISGGYAASLAYGADVGSPPSSHGISRPLPSPGYPNQSYGNYANASNYNNAQMDYGGTGGLQAPTTQRLSFDEGDEHVSLHSRHSGAESPSKDEYEDLFYHPGLTNRPLPAVPPGPGLNSDGISVPLANESGQSQLKHTYSSSTGSRYYPEDTPEAFYSSSSPLPQPERSVSASGHSNTPHVYAPARSRTDAAEERRKAGRHQPTASQSGLAPPQYDTASDAVTGAFDGITLPSGRKRRFIPSKLSAGDFRRCSEPWALSVIEAWIRDMADGEPDLREKTVEEALVHLFTFKVPTMNVADAETLSNYVVGLMLKSKLLLPEEEWVKFGDGHISGVLWQMTGSGCYTPKLHDLDTNGRCYSYHCTRTVKKVDLDDLDPEKAKTIDWHVFYGLTKEDIESKPKKEVERQNILHEIVTGEETYIKQLDLFRTLYRDDLRARKPPILKPDRLDKFLVAVFGKLDTVVSINKDNLLAQLKYRQQEQGPWITGFSDIFREWIRKAKTDYIEYAIGYPRAQYMVRKEAERNIVFKRFLEEKQRHKSMSKQDWTHFLITPLQRLQRYILLLESTEKKMTAESEEKTNLEKAIAEIRAVTLECDTKVDETNKRVEMMELDRMLILRPGFHSRLNLDHLGRQLMMQGELTRMGSKGVRWVDVHALLFDHYLILAKAVSTKDGRDKKYDVSKEVRHRSFGSAFLAANPQQPIPMPLLFLETTNDEPIQRQKGIATPLGRTSAASSSSTQLSKVNSNGGGRPGLDHVPTSSSMGSSLAVTPSGDSDGKILYPFKVKHLGHEIYTLYASSARDRLEWCNGIIEAKTNHAKALFSQNAEPFRLRVLADSAFHYDGSSVYSRTVAVPVKGTPLDRAIYDIESVLGSAQGLAPVCRAHVNCAAGFSAFGKSVIAIGTDYGVYISDPSNPRGWSRVSESQPTGFRNEC